MHACITLYFQTKGQQSQDYDKKFFFQYISHCNITAIGLLTECSTEVHFKKP